MSPNQSHNFDRRVRTKRTFFGTLQRVNRLIVVNADQKRGDSETSAALVLKDRWSEPVSRQLFEFQPMQT